MFQFIAAILPSLQPLKCRKWARNDCGTNLLPISGKMSSYFAKLDFHVELKLCLISTLEFL